MNKFLNLLFFLLLPFCLKGEIFNVKTMGKCSTIAVVQILERDNYPKILVVDFPIGKSVKVDHPNSVEKFVDCICRQTNFISPNSIFNISDLYERYWNSNNGNKQLYLANQRFVIEFDEKLNEIGKSIEYNLNDETKIQINYLNIYGFFIYGDKTELYPIGDNSLSIDYMGNKYIKNVWFLMTVVCYEKTDHNPFIFK